GRTWAAHLRRHPAGIDRVAQHLGPSPRDRESKRRHVEFALGIRTIGIPPTLDPVDVVQGIIAAMMHAASDIDQPFGSLDECRQHVWCERVYREDLRVSLWRRAAVGLA